MMTYTSIDRFFSNFLRSESGSLISRFFLSLALSVSVSTTACMKGSKTASQAKDGSNFVSTTPELVGPFPPNKSIPEAIRFVIASKEGRAITGIATEFKAFDITAAVGAGLDNTAIAAGLKAGWNAPEFGMDEKGAMVRATCDAGNSRENCVGILTGASKTTNQLGETSVGFTTPNYPSGVIAVAVRVPDDSAASQLLQFVTIRITSNEEFATSNIEKLESSLIVIPALFGKNGEQVLKAGVPFNLSLVIPGIPNTKPGQGFEFNFQVDGLGDFSNDKSIILPVGKLKCDFRNSQCVVPGGPFKVLKPGKVKFTVNPPNARFPVKPTSIELPITTGAATRIVLSLTPVETGINNACATTTSPDQPCLELSADESEIALYPVIVDPAGNFVSKTSTSWMATGPLSTRLKNGKDVLNEQILLTDKAGGGAITVSSVDFPGISTSLTYSVRSGTPNKIIVRNENQGFERAGKPFRAKVELYDKKGNLCVDYFSPLRLILDLKNHGGVNTDLPTGITASVSPVTRVDHKTSPILISGGQGITTGTFTIAKVDPNALEEDMPFIEVVEATVEQTGSSPAQLAQIDLKSFRAMQGEVNQTLLRTADLGRGKVWLSESNPCANDTSVYCMRTDKFYYFFNAGYDAAGNYVQDVPSDFWGMNYKVADPSQAYGASGKTAIELLKEQDPGDFAEKAVCQNPDKVPDPLFPDHEPTNQPLDGLVICSIHRALTVKSGTTTTVRAAGLAGAGYIVAIPKNRSIRHAISPRLKISGGTTTKFVIELRTNPILTNQPQQVMSTPVVAGDKFKMYVYAKDDQNFTTPEFSGKKYFYATRGGEPSWLGLKSSLPSGLISCTFGAAHSGGYTEPGVCELPGDYYVSSSRVEDTASIVLEQTAGATDFGDSGISDVIIPGSHSLTIPAVPGPEKRLVFTNYRAGVMTADRTQTLNGPPKYSGQDIVPLIPSSPLAKNYQNIDADMEKGFGVVITDDQGNYIRDANPTEDQLVFEGFESEIDSLTGKYDEVLGRWLDPDNKYSVSDIFAQINGKKRKFYFPSVTEDLESINEPFNKQEDGGKRAYTTIFIPQDSFGRGYAVAKSLVNPGLVGWPSPWMKVTPGMPDHVEIFPVADANSSTPLTTLYTGNCYRVKMYIKDVRGNVVTDYSGSPYGVFKLFNASLKQTLSYATMANFPSTGAVNTLYKDNSSGKHYFWQNGEYLETLSPDSETDSFYGFDQFPAEGITGRFFHDRLYDKYYLWDEAQATYVETSPPEVDVSDKFALDFARFREAQDPTRRSGYWGFAYTVSELLNYYDARNRSDIPGPYNGGFNLDTDNGLAGGGPPGGDRGFGFEKNFDAPPKHHENWVARYLNVYQGEIVDMRDEGGVCLYTGQTKLTRQDAIPTIKKYMQVDIEALDLSQNGGRSFAAITSRGAGRSFSKDSTRIFRSLAAPTTHGDILTTQRGAADHLHAVYSDSWEYPNLIPNTNGGDNAIVMVTDPANCPLGNFNLKCAGQRFYWHVHDWTHNYIRPAYSGTYTAGAARPYPYFEHFSSFPFASSIGYCPPGGNKSPCTMILPPLSPTAVPPVLPESRYMGGVIGHKIWGRETRPTGADLTNYSWPSNHAHLASAAWAETMSITQYFPPDNMALGTPPANSFKRGVYFEFFPGPVWELKLSRNGPVALTADDYFSFSLSLLDMYGNTTGAGTWQRTWPGGSGHSVARKLHVWYEQDLVNDLDVPQDAPSGAMPTLFGKTAKPTSLGAAVSSGTSYAIPAPSTWGGTFAVNLNPSLPSQQVRLVKANQTVRIKARVEDDKLLETSRSSGTGWCTGTKCKIAAIDGVPQRQYVEASIDVTAVAGARTGVVIYDKGKGLEYKSSNYQSIFQSSRPGDVFPIVPNALRAIETYLCDKDQFDNMGLCSFTATWEVVESSINEIISGGLNDQNKAFEWSPKKPGSFKLQASRNGLSFTSDPIIISGKPLDKFVIDQGSLLPSAAVNAGQGLPLDICMADDLDNRITTEIRNGLNQVVTDPNARLRIEFNSLLTGKNIENQSIEFSENASFASGVFNSGLQDVQFINGCARVYARVLNARDYNTPLFQLNFDDNNQLNNENIPKRITGNGLRVAKVTPLAAHHFASWPENTKNTAAGKQTQAWSLYGDSPVLASADGNIFDVIFEARDQYGNPTNYAQQINLKLRESSGDEITYNNVAWKPMCDNSGGTQCLNGTFQNQPQLLIQNIALDIGGRPIYVAAESSDGQISTSLENSTAVIPVTSAKTVASYSVDVSQASSVVAGQAFNVRVSALDKAGQMVRGAQTSLSDVDFEWFNLNQQGANFVDSGLIETNHKSLDGQSPIVKRNNSAKITFADGWADHPITLVKAETVRLNLREVLRSGIKSNNTSPTAVSAGSKVRYSVTCSSGGTPCNGSSFASTAQFSASPTSTFSLTVTAYDQYKNLKTDGPIAPAIQLVQDDNDTRMPGYLEQINGTPGTIVFDLNNESSDTRNNLFRRSSGAIKYTVSKASANWDAMYDEVYHTYTPHLDMVYSYSMTGVPSNPVAGITYNTTITARDIIGNAVTGLGTGLSTLDMEWRGSVHTSAPFAPVIGQSPKLTFNNLGVATTTVQFTKSEVISDFFLRDTYSMPAGAFTVGGLTYRRSGSLLSPQPLNIRSGVQPASFVLEHATGASTVTAGAGFNVKVTALDALGNVVQDYGTTGEALTFNWTSTGDSTDPNPRNATVLSPLPTNSPVNATFVNGVYTSSGEMFKLFVSKKLPNESNKTAVLTVGSSSAPSVTQGQLTLTVIPEVTPGYVLMTTTAAYTGSASVLSSAARTMSTDQTLPLYGHLFDQYGNYLRTDPGIRWRGTGDLTASTNFSQTPAASNTFAPKVTGSGTIVAECPDPAGSCSSHTSGTITVSASDLKTFTVEQTSPASGSVVNAGDIIDLKVCMRDVKSQLITTTVSGRTDPNSPNNLTFVATENSPLLGLNDELNSFVLSTSRDAFDNAPNRFMPGTAKSIPFSQGCALVYVKVLKSGSGASWTGKDHVQVSYNDQFQNNTIISGTGLRVDAVNALSLDHFVTRVSRLSPLGQTSAKSSYGSGVNADYAELGTGGNLFDLMILARDIYGNSVMPANGTPVTLSLLDNSNFNQEISYSGTTWRPVCGMSGSSNTDCAVPNFNGSMSSITIPKAAIDIGGRKMYIRATSGSVNTTLPLSTLIDVINTKDSVKYYTINNAPTTIKAGATRVIQVSAKDNAGQDVRNAADSLSSVAFNWIDSSGNILKETDSHRAPNAAKTVPILSDALQFNSAGQASSNITLVRVEDNLFLNIRDSARPSTQSNNLTPTTVTVGDGVVYALTCNKMAAGNADCTGSSSAAAMAASPTDAFKLTLNAYDEYQNPKSTITALPRILLTKTSGATTNPNGLLLEQNDASNTTVFGNQRVFDMTNKETLTVNNLFHRAGPHTIQYSVDPASVTQTGPMLSTVNHAYTAHPAMIYEYALTPPSGAITALSAAAFGIKALDRSGNLVSDSSVDTALNGLGFTFSGFAATGANAPTYTASIGTAPYRFSGGQIASYPITFRVAESFNLSLRDDYSPAVSGVGGYGPINTRRSPDVPVTVNSGGATKLTLEPSTITPVAGDSFNVVVVARDDNDNVVTSYSSGNLTFTWNAMATNTTFTGGSQSPVKPADGTKTFVNGRYTNETPFKLFYSNPTTLGAPQVVNLTVAAQGVAGTATVSFTVQPRNEYAYVRMTTNALYNTADDVPTTGTISMNTTDRPTYFGHLFDSYGNYRGLNSGVQWVGTGSLLGRFSPTPGQSSALTPNASGPGTFEARCNVISGASSCVSHVSANVNVSASPLDKFIITHATGTGAVAANSSVVAGTPIPLNVCMYDASNQAITNDVTINNTLITKATETISISIATPQTNGITGSPEGRIIEFSRSADFSNPFSLGSGQLDFVNGCAPLYAKIYSTNIRTAENKIRITYDDPRQSKTINGVGLNISSVTPAALHHYTTQIGGVQPTAGIYRIPANYESSSTDLVSAGGDRFTLAIYARDEYGNNVQVSADKPVQLRLLEENGDIIASRNVICPITNDTACRNATIPQGSYFVNVMNLRFDFGGRNLYIDAYDNNYSIKTTGSTVGSYSAKIYPTTSEKTVKDYTLGISNQITAGSTVTATVTARDAYGVAIQNAQSALTSQRYNFVDSTNIDIISYTAPNGAAPTLGYPPGPDRTLPFTNLGSASVDLTFVKTGALAIKVVDKQTTPRSSAVVNTTVNPGTTIQYKITCQKSDNSSCNGNSTANATVFDASPSTANRFSFTIQAYDQFENTRQGESDAYIKLVFDDGTATNVGRLESTDAVSVLQNEIKANTLTAGGNVTLTNLFHRSGNHTITYKVYSASNPNAGILSPIYHRFNAHGDMVYSYDLSLSPSAPVAGSPVSLSIQARDIAGNAVTGLQQYLNDRIFSWSGASNSPSGASPIGPTANLGFGNDGQSTSQTYTFRAAQTIATFRLEDQTSPTLGIGGQGANGRRIGTVSNVQVSNAAASQYELVSSNIMPKAGSQFSIDVIAKDAFGNLIKTPWTDSLTYSWTGASSQTNPRTSTTSNPVPSSATTINSAAFNSSTGVYTIGSLRLFRAGESPTFNLLGSSFSRTLALGQVQPSDNFDYVKIATSGTYSTSVELGGTPRTVNAGTDYTYFAHLFDEFGNLKAQNNNVIWTYSPVQAGTNATVTSPGSSTIFTPINTGSLNITASCSNLQGACVPDTSGTFTVQPGAITNLVWTVQPVGGVISQTTDQCVQLEVQAQDSKFNPVVSAVAITFTTTGGNGEFYDTAQACQNAQLGGLDENFDINKFHTPNESGSTRVSGSIGQRIKSLNSGFSTTQVWYANRTPGSVTVTASAGTAASLTGTVTAGAARRVTITNTETPIFATGATAGSDTCSEIVYSFQDRWGNSATTASTSNIRLDDGSAGGVFHSDATCSAPLTAASGVFTQEVPASNSTWRVYYANSVSTGAQVRLRPTSQDSSALIGGLSIPQGRSTLISVRPGPFDFNSHTSGTFQRTNPLSLTWTASSGGPTYSLSYSMNNDCSSAVTITPNPTTSTTRSWNDTSLNGQYFLCLTATGTAGALANAPTTNATTYGSYNLRIDNTNPTSEITQPSIADIGPLTVDTHDVSSPNNTVFRGTATDGTGGSGVSSVAISLRRGSGNFLNGSTFSSSTESWQAASLSSGTWRFEIADSVFEDGIQYTLRVRVTDGVTNQGLKRTSNTSNDTQATFTWRGIGPTAVLPTTGMPAEASRSSMTSWPTGGVQITGSRVVSYKYALVSAATCPAIGSYSANWTSVSTAISNAMADLSALSDGVVSLCVLGRDQAENIQSVASKLTWTKDTVKPTVTLPSEVTINTAAYNATPTITDVDETPTYSWTFVSGTNNCSNASFSPNATTKDVAISLTGCTNSWGTAQVRLIVTDRAQNASDPANMTIRWDQQGARITKIEVPSSGTPSLVAGRYSTGTVVPIRITFTKDSFNQSSFGLKVTGTPTLQLNIPSTGGGTNRVAQLAAGDYTNVSGTVTVNASYTVQAGDADQNRNGLILNAVSTTPFSFATGDVVDNTGGSGIRIGNANNTSGANALSASNIRIDTVGPTPSAARSGQASDGFVSISEKSGSGNLIDIPADAGDDVLANSATYKVILASESCNSSTTGMTAVRPTTSTAFGGLANNTVATYAVCMSLSDTANNVGYAKSADIVVDLEAPVFNYLFFTNAASDARINNSERSQTTDIVGTTQGTNVSHSGANASSGAIQYSVSRTVVTQNSDCSGRTYSSTVPNASSLVTTANDTTTGEGDWYICVKLTDAAGNESFGAATQQSISPTNYKINKDITAPTIDNASFRWQDDASDFYLSGTERDKVSAAAILTAATSPDTSATVSYALASTGSCDASQSYTYTVLPTRYDIGTNAEGTYLACVRFTDTHGNISYFRTQNSGTNSLTFDRTAPTLTINLASSSGQVLNDNFINKAERDGTATNIASVGTYSDARSGTDSTGFPKYIVQSSPTGANTFDSCNSSAFDSAGVSTMIQTNNASLGVDRDYRICAQGKDLAGNFVQATSSTFRVKITLPSFTAVVGPPASTGVNLANDVADGWLNKAENEKSTPPALVSVQSSADTTTTHYRIVSSATVCSSAISTWDSTALGNSALINSDATWKVCVRIGDAASNFVYEGSPTFQVDRVLPTSFTGNATNGFNIITSTGGITADTYVNKLEWDGSTTDILTQIQPNVDVNTVTFRYATVAPATTCSSTVSTWGTQFPVKSSLNAEGAFRFCAEIKDVAGNIGYATSPTITRNTTIPELGFSVGTLPQKRSRKGITSDRNLSVGILNIDQSLLNGSIADVTHYYAVVKAGYGGCDTETYPGSPVTVGTSITTDMLGYSDGWITICARAVDIAGNEQTPANASSYVFTKDTTIPVPVQNVGPTSVISNKMPTITWDSPNWILTPASPEEADPHTITVKVARDVACAQATASNSFAGIVGQANMPQNQPLTVNLDDGLWYICMTITDKAGNVRDVSGNSFVVETDTIHVSWTDSGGVKYARYSNLAWTSETVVSGGGSYDPRSSLQVDPSGVPYVGFKVFDGTNTSLRYKNRASGAWSGPESTVQVGTSSSIGLLNDLTINSSGNVISTFFGSPNRFILAVDQALDSRNWGTQYSDTASLVSPGDDVFGLAAVDGQLRITKFFGSAPLPLALPGNCNARYISAVAKTDNLISVALACRNSTDDSCSVHYGDIGVSGSTYTSPSWSAIGTIRSSGGCSAEDRPALMVNRVGGVNTVSVAWINQTNNTVNYWSNESGAGANQVLPGQNATAKGFAMLGIDKFGRSYIVYKEGDSLMFRTNNGRDSSVANSFPNTWTTAESIVTSTGITGVGSVGITGMRGRGNFTGGN